MKLAACVLLALFVSCLFLFQGCAVKKPTQESLEKELSSYLETGRDVAWVHKFIKAHGVSDFSWDEKTKAYYFLIEVKSDNMFSKHISVIVYLDEDKKIKDVVTNTMYLAP